MNRLKQGIVDVDLRVPDDWEFIYHRLFPIRRAYKPDLHDREISWSRKNSRSPPLLVPRSARTKGMGRWSLTAGWLDSSTVSITYRACAEAHREASG
jgi:hypothetical protein